MESALDWPVLGLSLFLAVLFGSLPFANFCFRCFGNFLTVTIEIVLTPLARFFFNSACILLAATSCALAVGRGKGGGVCSAGIFSSFASGVAKLTFLERRGWSDSGEEVKASPANSASQPSKSHASPPATPSK